MASRRMKAPARGTRKVSTRELLQKKALRLRPADRIGLVDRLLDSLDRPDPRVDALWAREVEDRLAAYRRGEIKTVGLGEILARVRKP